MSDEAEIKPGQIELINVTIINHQGKGVNLRELVLNLDIFEDIGSPFVTGALTFTDANSIAELFPIIGEEILILDMKTPEADGMDAVEKHYVYMVYKQEGQEPVALKNNVVTICFCSIEMFTDVNTRISKTYKGKISDLVTSFVKNEPGLKSYKEPLVEQTSNNEIFTSNFWTPAQNLYYLASKAINRAGYQNYMFFENNEGFVFASLDTMYAAPESMYWFKQNAVRNGESPPSLQEDYSSVLDYSVPVFVDYLDRVQTGYYGATIYHADIQTKRINYRNIVTKDDLKYPRLNPYLPFSERQLQFRPEAALTLNFIHRSPYNNSPVLPINHVIRRTALLSQLYSHTLNIQVFGRLNYTVGRTVFLTVYKNRETTEKDSDEQIIDELMTGKWIITSLNHSITRESHYCNIELCKDSNIKDLNEEQ